MKTAGRIAVAGLVGVACSDTEPVQYGDLEVLVMDQRDSISPNIPVAAWRSDLMRYGGRTDTTGHWLLEDLETGYYRASADTHESVDASCLVEPDETTACLVTIVAASPGTPPRFRAERADSLESTTLTWGPSWDGGLGGDGIISYQIDFRPEGGSRDTLMIVDDTMYIHESIDTLLAYRYWVSARNYRGRGGWSRTDSEPDTTSGG